MAKVTLNHVYKIYPGEKGSHVTAVEDVNLEIADREFVVLVGPSGCGKSTTLRMIAGLEEISRGDIYIGERRVNDVPPKDRDIAMVFQNYALYPHMSVFDNMAFGLKLRKYGKAEIKKRVGDAASILGIEGLLDRKPKALSGGQRQRVAVGRAIVRQPKVFLFDEPLSNLDAKLRADMRIELRDLQHRLGITSVYVTHDLEEALAMSDRIAVMRDGVIEQTGTPDEIYRLPRSAFVADFVGSANLIRGRLRTDLAVNDLIALETSAGHVVYCMAYGRPVGAELVVSVRTVHLTISSDRPAGTQNVWSARIGKTVFQGDFTQVHVGWGDQHLIARCAAMEPIAVGQEVYITVDPKRVVLLDA